MDLMVENSPLGSLTIFAMLLAMERSWVPRTMFTATRPVVPVLKMVASAKIFSYKFLLPINLRAAHMFYAGGDAFYFRIVRFPGPEKCAGCNGA
jgi:hypothetical protein